MINGLDLVKKRLVEANLANPTSFVGCTPSEIASLETTFGLRLPESYKEFLAAMGRAAGRFLVGTDFLLKMIDLQFREGAEKLLRCCESGFVLPSDAYVFLFHQGYTFLFFRCAGHPDPPLSMFTEAESFPLEVARSFSTWLVRAVDDQIAVWREVQRLGKKLGRRP